MNATTEIRAVAATSRDALESPSMPTNMSEQDQETTHRVVLGAYVETIRLVMLLAAALTWCGALAAALAVGPPRAIGPPRPRERPVLAAITKPS